MTRPPAWRDPAFWHGFRRGYVAGCLLALAFLAGLLVGVQIARGAEPSGSAQEYRQPRPWLRIGAAEQPAPLPAPAGTAHAAPSSPLPAAPSAVPSTAAPALAAMAGASAPATPRVVAGIASTYGSGWAGWLALPEGPGVTVRVCGPAACIVRTSNDAGPDLAMQRAGRVVDLGPRMFEQVCGCAWTRGLVEVTVEYLR